MIRRPNSMTWWLVTMQGHGAGVVGEVHAGQPESVSARAWGVGTPAWCRGRMRPSLRQRDVGSTQCRQQFTQCSRPAARGRQGRSPGSPAEGSLRFIPFFAPKNLELSAYLRIPMHFILSWRHLKKMIGLYFQIACSSLLAIFPPTRPDFCQLLFLLYTMHK